MEAHIIKRMLLCSCTVSSTCSQRPDLLIEPAVQVYNKHYSRSIVVGQQNTLIARSSFPRTTITSTGERVGLFSWNSTVALIEFYGRGYRDQRLLNPCTSNHIPFTQRQNYPLLLSVPGFQETHLAFWHNGSRFIII